MFSTVKLIAAGAIVALFGGFLLTSIFTMPQSDEAPPAAVTASPAAEVTGEPTEAPDPSVRTDILPGVALTVEEVEPGVFLVIDDGVRDLAKANNLDIVAGHDGGIWLLRHQRYFRLGGDEGHAWPTKEPEVGDFEVAPDGTVWAMSEGGLYSVGRGSDDWTLTKGDALVIEVTSDGTVWALWPIPESKTVDFGYLGADGWQSVGEWPPAWYGSSGVFKALGKWDRLLVSDRGEVWALDGHNPSRDVRRFVDGEWLTYPDLRMQGGHLAGSDQGAAVGADGTLWGTTNSGASFRFDGTGWMTFGSPDWMPTELGLSEPHVAPDGSLWERLDVERRGSECQFVRDHGIDGVARFDGVAWSRFLRGYCVEEMDIATGGSVWLLASEPGSDLAQVYVISPEAVTAIE